MSDEHVLDQSVSSVAMERAKTFIDNSSDRIIAVNVVKNVGLTFYVDLKLHKPVITFTGLTCGYDGDGPQCAQKVIEYAGFDNSGVVFRQDNVYLVR